MRDYDLSQYYFKFENAQEWYTFLGFLYEKMADHNPKPKHSSRDLLNKTHLACTEDIEDFFGIYFGEDEELGKAFNQNILRIIDADRFPAEFPCLFLVYSLECITDGRSRIKYSETPVFIYKSDFDKQ